MTVTSSTTRSKTKTTPKPPVPKAPVGRQIFPAMVNVMTKLSKDGVGKTGTNESDGYAFRGIDAVMNALSPLLAENHILIVPRCISRDQEERRDNNGIPMLAVTVEAEFDFVCAKDESQITVRMFGEAMDGSDKATNKAMTAAYKYAVIQAFCIPTDGENDGDASSPKPKLSGTDLDKYVATIRERLAACQALAEVEELWSVAIASISKSNHRLLTTYFDKRRADLDPAKTAALEEPATESAIRVLKAKVTASGLSEEALKSHFKFGFDGMTKAQHNAVTAWLKTQGAQK